mmetsp:Transcript_12279/g.39284  ORF Transcript_12279/g.39284 Transcript_12279/m.39284 type:complete len:219 (+) Transcript_12279:385-1041(+)
MVATRPRRRGEQVVDGDVAVVVIPAGDSLKDDGVIEQAVTLKKGRVQVLVAGAAGDAGTKVGARATVHRRVGARQDALLGRLLDGTQRAHERDEGRCEGKDNTEGKRHHRQVEVMAEIREELGVDERAEYIGDAGHSGKGAEGKALLLRAHVGRNHVRGRDIGKRHKGGGHRIGKYEGLERQVAEQDIDEHVDRVVELANDEKRSGPPLEREQEAEHE